MILFSYDENTGEYIESFIADADPEESYIQNKFVPLIPKNATTKVVPTYGKDQIPVFTNSSWEIKEDFRHNYHKVDSDLNVFQIDTIGPQPGFYIVSNEVAEDISQNPSRYKVQDGKVVKKSDFEYEKYAKDKEKLRVKLLHLTAADVERGLYRALGINFEDLIKLVTEKAPECAKELKIELRANNFYRGNLYIDKIGNLLGISSKQLDKFFDTKDYKALL